MIIPFKGKVKYPITLDAGTWIFDDRKIDLNTYFDSERAEIDELENYTKQVGQFFDREIKEGATPPSEQKPKKRFLKEILLTGTFGMKLAPFIKTAEPYGTTFVLETPNGDVSFPIEEAYSFIAAFSKEGKRLEDGPIHILFEDGSNKDNPIKSVNAFRIE
ncbi:hypothetical protein AN964_15450 [Heyndrickxia shackletonii]|uniref:Peptidyl-prolyl cis-trans isomerase n=1 Tax=Heyndrickxia shackletonii TaxID=157838 RepID=A0A0Q3WZG6_9BACI|nr:hypothetical protein [Heyndrickxia shackletonii]KQL54764.1 hypothetical protein AN964_15450 [Heyndrickxia shackletonii]MBB2480400.1 peptidyl-prolyl cis-trans isomerase [Bacillus sp. APMAM]NEY98420.1 peptidyl-prolyl cis-trans isomerase [Heyndrickxia shackletonii]RTZ57492.1 peptidyl-prolyl cis-trans isomerase [Bacillus sp. SAJ1]